MKRFVRIFVVLLCCMMLGACVPKHTTPDGIDMGRWEESNIGIMGVSYNLYSNGYAEICNILNSNCVLSDTVSYEGKEYTVVAIKGYAGVDTSIFEKDGTGYCEAPEVLDLPDEITYIDKLQLAGCSSKEIHLPENLKRYRGIGGCENVEKIDIPASVEKIYMDNLYWKCTNLKEVTFPENCTYIPGSYVFYDCDALENLSLPDGLEVISDYTFVDCDVLSEISLGKGIKKIYANAFVDLPALTEIVIPDNVTRLDSRAFVGCFALKDVYLSDNLADIPTSLFSQNGLDDMDVSGITIHVKESLVDYTKSLYPTANVVAK